MIFGVIVSIISFFLDAFLSNCIMISTESNAFIIPMFTIVSLIIIYPFFNNNISCYLKTCAIIGLFYDILFTNTLGLNVTMFFILGYIITSIDNILSNNLISMIIKMIIMILIYDIFTYFILFVVGYINYSIIELLYKLLKSLLLNFIYTIILYFITNNIAKRYKIKRSN